MSHKATVMVKCSSDSPPVSLPRLVDFDWRVDVKTSSDSMARMAQPTCLVQMKVGIREGVGGPTQANTLGRDITSTKAF